LRYLLERAENLGTLVFRVDLPIMLGSLPRDMRDVWGWYNDIMFLSRTRLNADPFRRIHTLRHYPAKARESDAGSALPDKEQLLQELSDRAPVLEDVSAVHTIRDLTLTLGLGMVVHDYLR
jgi:hypothetical protein